MISNGIITSSATCDSEEADLYQQQKRGMSFRIRPPMTQGLHLTIIVFYLAILLVVIGYLTGGIENLYFAKDSHLSLVEDFSLLVEPLNFISCLLVLIYGCWIYKKGRLMLQGHAAVRSVWVCSVILAFLFVCGSCAAQTKSIYPFYGSMKWLLLTWISVATMSVFAYSIVASLFYWLRNASGRCYCNDEKWSSGQLLALFSIILILGWLPYIVVFAPGSSGVWDTAWQLSQFFGYTEYSSHHPLASTLIYGAIGKIGYQIGGDNGVIMAITLFQTGCFALAFAFELVVIKKVLHASVGVIVCALLFYIALPIFGSFCQWNIKDSVFAAVFTCYMTLFVLFVIKVSTNSEHRAVFVALLVSAVGVGLLRNNGIFIVFCSLPFIGLFLPRKNSVKLRVSALSIVACICIPLFNLILVVGLDAQPGSIREALSIPFQQTARYAQRYPNDVEEWERERINRVLPYDLVTERYDWSDSGQVKNRYKESSEYLPGYFRAWLSQGLKHPEVYIEATVLNSYGFWYVESKPSYEPYLATYFQDDAATFSSHSDQADIFTWSYYFEQSKRDGMVDYIDSICQIPLLSILCQPGIYTWIVILGCCYLAYRGKKLYMHIYSAPILVILTCIAGPVCGYFRYELAVVSCAPLLIWATLFLANQEQPCQNCMQLSDAAG